MKAIKISHTLLFFAACVLLASCLKDQKDVFSQPASQRMQETLKKAQATLVDSKYGWLFEIYPEAEQSYGGYAYICKFDDDKVTVTSELDGTTNSETSLYKMTNDMGPVLSFDLYNKIFHYFSTPSGQAYHALGGDFEFIIDSIGNDLIKLHARRTGNELYMRKMTEPAEDYLQKILDIQDNFIVKYLKGNIEGTTFDGSFDMDNRHLNYMFGEDEYSEPFTFTPTGIRFYHPLNFNGKLVSEMTYNPEPNTFTFTPVSGSATTLQGSLPEDYVLYKEIAGKYELKLSGNRFQVSLEPTEDKSGFRLVGLSKYTKPFLKYNKVAGNLVLTSQLLGTTSNGIAIWFCAWDSRSGKYTWNTSVGMYVTRDPDAEGFVLTFSDNGIWRNQTVNSFMIKAFDGEPSSETYLGNVSDRDWFIPKYKYRFFKPKTLTKIE